MGKKNVDETTVAPETTVVTELPVAPENPDAAVPTENLEVPEKTGTAETPEAEPTSGGVDIQNTALAGIEGTLSTVSAVHGLNLRKGPNRQFGVIEVLPDGALVSELALPYGAEVAGWALIHTGLQIGWVDDRYLAKLKR